MGPAARDAAGGDAAKEETMISREENERWTRVGPGTPGGEMLRRYWWPIAFSDGIDGPRPRKVRLLGEDFVLFRDGDGRLGMLESQCAHRRAPMEYGRVEAGGVRCCYHGWLWSPEGRCLETPCEEPGSTLKDRVRMKAYPVQVAAGLVFAYIGPQPAPLLPRYDMLVHASGTRYVYGNDNHCNWLQTAENAADLTHLNWLHAGPYPMYAGKPSRLEYQERDYGFDYTSTVPGMPAENFGSVIFPCHNRFASARTEQGGSRQNMLFRTPQDDTTTLNFFITVIPREDGTLEHHTEMPPERPRRGPFVYNERGVYSPADDGWWGVSSFDQDRMVVEGQGPIYDRTGENLASSDRGIAIYRRMLKESLAAVAEGRDPIGVIRDAAHPVLEFGTRLHRMEPPLRVVTQPVTA
jgi:5,5'-dehydrodivanillate O-demethylase